MYFWGTVKSQINLIQEALFQLFVGVIRKRFPLTRSEKTLILVSQNSKTFNGKLAKKMLSDHSDRVTLVADKLRVRDFVEEQIGPEYLTKLYQVVDSPNDINWENLPNRFVVKVNHGSGGIFIVGNFLNPEVLPLFLLKGNWPRYLLNYSEFNSRRISRLLRQLVRKSYFYLPNKFPEWAYVQIKPKILIEEYLEQSDQRHPPSDFKFFCFNGVCKVIQLDSDRFTKHTRQMLDPGWNLLPFSFTYPNSGITPDKPKNLEHMIEIAERLAGGFDFIRVDLFNIDGKVYFGELTNYPESALGVFDPNEWNYKLGEFWTAGH
jgi:hypothetical protein